MFLKLKLFISARKKRTRIYFIMHPQAIIIVKILAFKFTKSSSKYIFIFASDTVFYFSTQSILLALINLIIKIKHKN